MADEPTGNLDSRTGKEILELFRRLNVEQGITILLVTHDLEVARFADRLIRIADGRITDDSSLARRRAKKGRRGEGEKRSGNLFPPLPFSPFLLLSGLAGRGADGESRQAPSASPCRHSAAT